MRARTPQVPSEGTLPHALRFSADEPMHVLIKSPYEHAVMTAKGLAGHSFVCETVCHIAGALFGFHPSRLCCVAPIL
jgi:hypothetical protein